jgi:hypothetical protein
VSAGKCSLQFIVIDNTEGRTQAYAGLDLLMSRKCMWELYNEDEEESGVDWADDGGCGR